MSTPDQPPTCPEWAPHGHCVLDQGHDGRHLPLPVRYPPLRLPEHLRTEDINDYLRQKGEIA